MANKDVQMSLRSAVDEVMTLLTGLDLSYDPSQDRFHAVTRCLNRALRQVALEHEWAYFSTVEDVGIVAAGQQNVELTSRQRLRIVNDDAIRLADATDTPRVWAYILPRDALHKYAARQGLWASITRSTITFSRPFTLSEAGLKIMVPVMREPQMFEVPPAGSGVSDRLLNQLVDFDYPDLVTARAAYIYAQSDPVLQPRVQTLEAQYKDIMYQLIERDDRHTDSAFMNEFIVPIQNSINGSSFAPGTHGHPHSDERFS